MVTNVTFGAIIGLIVADREWRFCYSDNRIVGEGPQRRLIAARSATIPVTLLRAFGFCWKGSCGMSEFTLDDLRAVWPYLPRHAKLRIWLVAWPHTWPQGLQRAYFVVRRWWQ